MTNLKSKQVKKAKGTNNEKWFSCQDCEFDFIIYKKVKRHFPFCPNCGESANVVKTEAKSMVSRESYRTWTPEEIELVTKVANGEMMPYQCAMLLDRSKSSVSCKARRIRVGGIKNDNL